MQIGSGREQFTRLTEEAAEVVPLAERVFRLRLLEGLMLACNGPWGTGGDVRQRGLVVEDLIRIRREMPYPVPGGDESATLFTGLLASSRSETVRGLDRGIFAMIVCAADGASRLPYVPTLDELVLE